MMHLATVSYWLALFTWQHSLFLPPCRVGLASQTRTEIELSGSPMRISVARRAGAEELCRHISAPIPWTCNGPEHSCNIAADLMGEVLPWAEGVVNERRENLGKGYMTRTAACALVRVVTLRGHRRRDDEIIQTPAVIVILNS